MISLEQIIMPRYVVNQFDGETFVVLDQNDQREVCICANYDEWADAENRAQEIASLLNGYAASDEL